MVRLYRLMLCGLFASVLLITEDALAQNEKVKYVNDMLYVDVRSAAGLQAEKIEVIPSGTRLVVMEEGVGDYIRVRLDSGVEGWVLGRYLTDEPIARTRVEAAQTTAESLRTERSRLYTDINKLKEERNTLKTDLQRLQTENEAQGKELAEIRTTSGAAVGLSNRNRQLQVDLAQETQRRTDAESHAQGAYLKLFMVGVICAVVGAALGFYFGSAPSRREKKWRRMPV